MVSALLLAVLLGAVLAPAALAHPLGNFTRNSFVGLVVQPEEIGVVVRLDLAELPTLLEAQQGDVDADGTFDDAEVADHARETCDGVFGDVAIELDGRALPPAARTGVSARLDEGEAGLDTLLVTCRGRVELTDGIGQSALDLDAASTIGPDWLGWRELVVTGAGGVEVLGDDVRTASASSALLAYPDDDDVLEETSATALLRPGQVGDGPLPAWATSDAGDAQEVVRVVDRDLDGGGFLEDVTGRFTDLVAERELTVGFVLLAVGLALLLGGTHALAPGHGKTVMAAYVVGQRGTTRQALAIAGVVAVTHTFGVLGLGLLLTAGESVVPEDLYPWFGAISGLLLVAVGVDLLRRALGSRAAARAGRARHDQVHDHGHDHREDLEAAEQAAVGATTQARAGAATTTTRDARGAHVVEHHAAGLVGDGDADATGGSSEIGPQHDHDHPHGSGHGHGHVADGWVVHDHGGGAHAHPIPGADVTPRTLLAMGLAGGLVPSPSALLVLLGAIAIGRTAFGVVLVIAYGFGLAATLVGGGLLLVRFREGAERLLARRRRPRVERLLAAMPVLTAVAVLLGGLLVVGRSLLL